MTVPAPPKSAKHRKSWFGRAKLGAVLNIRPSLPRRTAWLVAALPLAGILVFIASGGASEPKSDFTAAFSKQWKDLQAGIAERAAVSLHDDFRSGLAQWEGNGNWSGSWSFDRSGLVRPGRLALYKPSLGLSEYRMEFSVHVEQGGIGWVCRAKDSRNYQALKLLVGRVRLTHSGASSLSSHQRQSRPARAHAAAAAGPAKHAVCSCRCTRR